MRYKFLIPSLLETQFLAVQLAQFCATHRHQLQPTNQSLVIPIEGDLGTGKTAFCRYFIQSLSDPDTLVTSPSYNLVNTYLGWIYHLDCYRLNTIEELELLGIRQQLAATKLFLIEWPHRLKHYFGDSLIDINLRLNREQRQLSFIINLSKDPVLSALQHHLILWLNQTQKNF